MDTLTQYIEWKTNEVYKDLINDEGTFGEAMENIRLLKDGIYNKRIFQAMIGGDVFDLETWTKELFSEYCTEQATIIAQNAAEGMTDEEMKEEMSGYISCPDKALYDTFNAITLERVQ